MLRQSQSARNRVAVPMLRPNARTNVNAIGQIRPGDRTPTDLETLCINEASNPRRYPDTARTPEPEYDLPRPNAATLDPVAADEVLGFGHSGHSSSGSVPEASVRGIRFGNSGRPSVRELGEDPRFGSWSGSGRLAVAPSVSVPRNPRFRCLAVSVPGGFGAWLLGLARAPWRLGSPYVRRFACLPYTGQYS